MNPQEKRLSPSRDGSILDGVRRMLFVGDSLTDGSDYPDYVVNTLNRHRPWVHIECLNAALCGNTAADLVRRLDRDILSQRPDLVSICIGTNDCCRGRSTGEYARDLEYLIVRLQESGARVLLMTPSPVGDPERERLLRDYLAIIRRLAELHTCVVADAHELFIRWAQAGREMLGADGIHHGDSGFEGMARAVLDAVGFVDTPMEKSIMPWPYLLTEWEMSAPFLVDQAPSTPREITKWHHYDRVEAATVQPWWDAPFAARGGFMPFFGGRPAMPSVVFGRSWYEADAETVAEVQLGAKADKVWVNGEMCWLSAPENFAGYHPNASRFPATLQAGRNEIVVLTSSFCFLGIRELSPAVVVSALAARR